jgi:hypothetical protein
MNREWATNGPWVESDELSIAQYALWWHEDEWCVIAQQRMGKDPVVSVQFKPQSPKRHAPKPPSPRPTVSREREPEYA